MNAIDCLVHPQVGTEAFGLVICEAFACGKPVIASELDGIPEAFSATRFGTLVQPESVEALAAAMLEWGRKEKPSLEFRNSLHQKVKEQFSLEAFATRNLALYRALIDHGASIGKQGR
jgi:glycosyltransferase involved in cell wall biosynthesis